ncbi:MAG: hypothetical protein HFF18_09350 [Oscillospiraceae bacterium]|nr:hypothetical protein [Oscillospiraceae bacterium]
MPLFDKKLIRFTQMMMSEADAETRAAESEIREARETARAEAEDQVLQESYQYIKTEVARLRTESGRRISRQMQENRKKLYLRREEMAGEVFEVVRGKLRAYVETPAYEARLRALLAGAMERVGQVTRLTVFLRKQDMKYGPKLAAAAGKVQLALEEGDFLLGGLTIESEEKKLRVDATFDTALEELSGHFAEQFGLSLAD